MEATKWTQTSFSRQKVKFPHLGNMYIPHLLLNSHFSIEIQPIEVAHTNIGHPVWDSFGICLGQLLDMFETALGHVWDMFRTCLGHVSDMFGTSLGSVWDMLTFSRWETFLIVWC